MEEISIVGKDGDVVARNNLILCFFGQTTVREWAVAGTHCLQQWLKIIPQDTLRWTLIGASASQYAAMNPRSVGRCQALMATAKSKNTLASFELLGPDRYAPDFSISWKAQPESSEPESEYTNFVEMRFPASFLDRQGSDSFIKWAIGISRDVLYDSGYSGISLVTHESVVTQAGKAIAPLALRHYGYDVSDNGRTSFDLGNRCRGAQWLTFLGASTIQRLGGKDRILPALSDYDVVDAKNGLAIVTSEAPEVGDTNRKNLVQHLRPLAKLLEPLTYFGDYGLDGLLMDDPEKRERWERRFLD